VKIIENAFMPKKDYLIITTLIGILILSNFNIVGSTPCINDNEVEYWAVLVSMFADYERFSYYQDILCSHGWTKDHILLTVDNNTKSFTKQDMINVLTWLDEKEDENDISLILISAHGSPTTFVLSDASMSYEELNSEINHLESEGICVILEPCYSGGAIPYLEKEGRVIITGCATDETCIGFRGGFEFGLEGIGDYIGGDDGLVSAEEIFDYISMIDLMGRHPQIADNYQGDLNLISLDTHDRSVDQKQTLFITDIFLLSFGSNRYLAQSFIPSSSILLKIKLGLRKITSTMSPIVISIRHELTGDDLTTAYVDGSQLYDGIDMVVEFDFPDIVVIPGETYYIICSAPDTEEYYYIAPQTINEDVYANGYLQLSHDSGATWFTDERYRDLFFITFESPLTPELSIRITGGLAATATITNSGDTDATNCMATFTITGGLIFVPSGGTNNIHLGTVAANGGIETAKTMIFGLGKPTITVTVTCDERVTATTMFTTKFLLFFLLLG
jgi:hypothetical protein